MYRVITEASNTRLPCRNSIQTKLIIICKKSSKHQNDKQILQALVLKALK